MKTLPIANLQLPISGRRLAESQYHPRERMG
jgi:hypothetical protein